MTGTRVCTSRARGRGCVQVRAESFSINADSRARARRVPTRGALHAATLVLASFGATPLLFGSHPFDLVQQGFHFLHSQLLGEPPPCLRSIGLIWVVNIITHSLLRSFAFYCLNDHICFIDRKTIFFDEKIGLLFETCYRELFPMQIV